LAAFLVAQVVLPPADFQLLWSTQSCVPRPHTLAAFLVAQVVLPSADFQFVEHEILRTRERFVGGQAFSLRGRSGAGGLATCGFSVVVEHAILRVTPALVPRLFPGASGIVAQVHLVTQVLGIQYGENTTSLDTHNGIV
jgi:hypothetical protein